METSALLPKLEKKIPGAVLEARPFGRSGALSLWIEMRSLVKIAQTVKDDPAFAVDWLENLTVMEIDDALVLSYFLRSTQSDLRMILRGSLVPSSSEAEVDAESVRHIWPMAAALEKEASDLFGIRFMLGGKPADSAERLYLPQDWIGYPLRKSYVFPMEYLDIPHSRPVGQTEPDEFGVVP